jgi:hypothetical protein
LAFSESAFLRLNGTLERLFDNDDRVSTLFSLCLGTDKAPIHAQKAIHFSRFANMIASAQKWLQTGVYDYEAFPSCFVKLLIWAIIMRHDRSHEGAIIEIDGSKSS